MSDSFRTIEAPCGPYEVREKGSRFLAYAAPVALIEEAEQFITTLRKRFHDAAHIGWACRLGEGEEIAFRYSDGGEPSGTAGIPIYQELVRADLFNVVCAVVRYFGGVKLGTGGLARAFGGAARGVLTAAPIRIVVATVSLSLDVPFEQAGLVMRLGEQYAAAGITQEYHAQGVRITMAVPRSRKEAFVAVVRDKSGGRVTPC